MIKESVYYLTEKGHYKLPIVPPPLRDHGMYVISINKFVKWMAAKVEAAGITIFTGFAGSELLFDQDGVTGVRTDDKGVDKQGKPRLILSRATISTRRSRSWPKERADPAPNN